MGWDFFPRGWDICSQGVGQEVLMKNEECECSVQSEECRVQSAECRVKSEE